VTSPRRKQKGEEKDTKKGNGKARIKEEARKEKKGEAG